MRLFPVLIVLVNVVLVACSKFTITPSGTPSPFVPKQIWSGTSDGYQITWTTADVTAFAPGAPPKEVFSEIGRTIVDFHGITHGQTADCDMTRQASLQSVVGTIISVRTADTMKCVNGASGAGRGTQAFDLAHPQQPLALSSLFPVHELAALQTKAKHFCSTVPKDLLTRFAFSQLHRDAVIVAVTLPASCTTAEVDLALNIPGPLKQPLENAAQRAQGFLVRDQAAVSGGQSTTVNYHYRAAVE